MQEDAPLVRATSWGWTTPCSSTACVPDTFDYSKSIMAKFQYTDFVQNHCQEPYSPQTVVEDGARHLSWCIRAPASATPPTPPSTWCSTCTSTAAPQRRRRREFGVRIDLGELVNENDLIKSICVSLGVMNHIHYRELPPAQQHPTRRRRVR